MWKQILVKFWEKAKIWLKATGFTNVAYLALAFGLMLGIIPLFFLGFLKTYLVGAFLGIFCYINWNMIVKIYKAKIGDKIDDVIDKLEDKMS